MKIRFLFLVFSALLLVNTLCLPVQAKNMIYDTLGKGSEWTLNVDGEEGALELLGGSGASTGGSGWRMNMEIRWQGVNGSLRAETDNDNSQQRVVLALQRQNGMAVTCEGYIAQETDRFMAGVTRYPSLGKDTCGAWYAVKNQTTPVGPSRKPPLRTEIIKNARREILSKDSEPPKVDIKIEGILVFTLNDKIKIRASAEDNVKIAQITVYIDHQEMKTCQAWECRYSETLTQPGPHKCWATAVDAAGNKGQSAILEFMVQPTAKPGPSLNTKIQPYKPTSQDTVTFLADASHSSGVESITIYVNGQAVQTCNQSHCEYVGGPYGGPEIAWRVSAKSRDGGITYGHDITVPITQKQAGYCSISGKAYGSGAGLASVFFVILYGPDNLSLHRETQPFGQDGIYSFTGLPTGKYKLVVDSKADTTIGPHPASRVVECSSGPLDNIDFELK
ncbi:MAG: hypothetical protein NT166_19055 [Candidatus Aminicenantes bacterium]|nr:hypothetical protein [Candidatus Aminicenantes bacterium]